jgi:hypothetical protein
LDLPNHAYYRSCHGSFRCELDLAITDWAAFRACRMGSMDRLRMGALVLWPKLIGRFVFETTVDYTTNGARGEVVHTTRVSKWGITFLRGVEILSLDENGRDFRLRAEHRFWPAMWRVRKFDGHGQVDETGTRATYSFPWFGTTMRQTTLAEEGGATITQETEWSRGVQRLRPTKLTPHPLAPNT